MKKLLLYVLGLLFMHTLFAQEFAWVRGRVTDAQTGLSLPGANILAGQNKGVTSGTNGQYQLRLKVGAYLLKISYMGYNSRTDSILLAPGDTLIFNLALNPSNALLNEVVVSAEKFEQRIAEVNISMAVLKPERILESQAISLDEVLNQLSGVQIIDGQPGIRGGSGFSYGAGSRVLLVMDGLPLMSGDAGDVKWNFLPVDNLSQVEIIKGASSVLYGSSALNGVINLRTKEPQNQPETSMRIYSGAYLKPARRELIWSDSPRLFAGVSLNDSRKIGHFDLGSGLHLYKNQGNREDEYEKRARMDIHLQYNPSDTRWSFGLNMNGMLVHSSDFFLWQNADSGAYRQNPEGVVPLSGYRITVDPSVTFHSGEKGIHSLKTRYFGNVNTMPDRPEKNNRFSLMLGEYRYSRELTPDIRLTLGAYDNYTRVQSRLYGNHYRNEMAFFAQMNATLFGKLKGTLGFRWENYKLDDQWTTGTPVFRAGLNYKLFPFTRIRASFGQGYRFPSIAEKYTATSVGALNIFPNPMLTPETGWSAEAGLLQGFQVGSWKGSVDWAVYRNEYRNMIEFTFGLYLPDSVLIPDLRYVGFKALNVGKARITGTEVLVNLTGETEHLKFNFQGGYNFNLPVDLNIQKTDSTSNILKYRYRHSVKGDAGISYKKWSTGITLVHNSFMERVDEVFTDPLFGNLILPGYPAYRQEHQKGYTVVDWRLACQIFPACRLSATLKNLFNVEYMGRPGDIRPQRSCTLQFYMRF